MKFKVLWIPVLLLLLCGFDFPNEKKFLAQKIANIHVWDGKGHTFEIYDILGEKPLIISPVYTRCRSICGVISNGVQTVINQLKESGEEFNVISFSFDSSDTQADLASYEKRWKMDGMQWRTLSATSADIGRLMSSIGYQYDYDSATGEFNHPSILIVVSPSGKISRYIYGVNPSGRDLRVAVMGAMAEKTRPGIFKGFILRCLRYDAALKTYKIDWRWIISTSAGLIMVSLMTWLFIKSFIVSKKPYEQTT